MNVEDDEWLDRAFAYEKMHDGNDRLRATVAAESVKAATVYLIALPEGGRTDAAKDCLAHAFKIAIEVLGGDL